MSYTARLKREWADRSSRTKNAQRFFDTWTGAIHKYKGGMPAGFMAAIAQWESNGTWNTSGDTTLGEVGFFQISQSAPRNFGISPSVRTNKQGNIFLAGLEYNYYASRLMHHFPSIVKPASADQWILARLAFAIGWGGATELLKRSKPAYGFAYRDVVAYVDKTGGIPLGRQSAGKVWFRTHAVLLQWRIGMDVAMESPGYPEKVPGPVKYTVPSDGKLMSPWVPVLGAVAMSLGLALT